MARHSPSGFIAPPSDQAQKSQILQTDMVVMDDCSWAHLEQPPTTPNLGPKTFKC